MSKNSEGYLLEFITVGNSVKVCAIDPKTGIEISIVGPKSASQKELSRNAVNRLLYVLEKKGLITRSEK